MMPSKCEWCGKPKLINRKLCDKCDEIRRELVRVDAEAEAMLTGLRRLGESLGGIFDDRNYPANSHEVLREDEYRAHGG